jgi:phosphoglycolate phosphatase
VTATQDAVIGVMSGVRGLVFDKDGTLIDLDARWVPAFNRLIGSLADRCDDPSLVGGLAALLGLDGDRLVADGPAAVDTIEQIISRVMAELVDRGRSPDHAEKMVGAAVGDALAAVGSIEAIGELVVSLRAMRAGGLCVGVATSDDRANTVTELTDLGAIDLVDTMRCADDGGPVKPDPGVLTSIAAEWGIAVSELVFVGDSRNDMHTARAAGCSFVARCDRDRWPRWTIEADAIVSSIDELVPR